MPTATPVTPALAISTEFPRNADVSLTTPRIADANLRRMTSTQTIGVIGSVRHNVSGDLDRAPRAEDIAPSGGDCMMDLYGKVQAR